MSKSFQTRLKDAFNWNIIESNRNIWVDYLRGVAIILVVYHHAFLGMEKNSIEVPELVVDANMAAYSFRMPLFFIFSGIFTALSLRTKTVKNIIWNKYNLILYPYLIWSFLQITLQFIFSRYTNTESDLLNYLYILYQPKQIAHFWYLPALFNATLVFVLIKSKFKVKAGHHLILGLVLFMAAPFVNSISMMSNWMRFYIFLVVGDMLCNVILQKEVQDRLKKLVYFLSIIPLFLAAQYYYFYVLGASSIENVSAKVSEVEFVPYIIKQSLFLTVSLVGCATLILFSFLLEKWNLAKWLRVIGYHSLYIYIMHVIVVAFNRIVLTKAFGIDNYAVILVTGILVGVTVPIVFYNVLGKKQLWFLFSSKKRKKPEEISSIQAPVIRVNPEVRLSPLKSVNNI